MMEKYRLLKFKLEQILLPNIIINLSSKFQFDQAGILHPSLFYFCQKVVFGLFFIGAVGAQCV